MSDQPQQAKPSRVEVTALESITRGEIDLLVRTAKAYPRNIDQSIDEAKSLACKSEDIAGSCMYSIPRKNAQGKAIEITGASVRLAEIIAHSWGNMRVAARDVGNDGRTVTAEAVCYDVEKNVAIAKQSTRRIIDKTGRQYSDDMVVMTMNAAKSLAFRNAVFACVPRALWEEVYEAAKETAIGKAESMDSRRAKMVDHLSKMGVSEERVLAAVERTSLRDVTRDDLIELRGLVTAIKDGTPIEDAFPEPKPPQSKDPQPVAKTLDDVVAKATRKTTPPKAGTSGDSPDVAADPTAEATASDSPPSQEEQPSDPDDNPELRAALTKKLRERWLGLKPAKASALRKQFDFEGTPDFSTWKLTDLEAFRQEMLA